MEMIPEFLSGRLAGAEREEFLQAMDLHPTLADAVEEERALRAGLQRMAEETEPDSRAILARIEQKIGTEQKAGRDRPGMIHQMASWMTQLFSAPRLAWGLCAVQALALVLLLVARQPEYRTMSVEHRPHSGEIVMNVIFKEDTKVPQMVLLLKKIHGKIIDGPGQGGLFIVKVPEPQAAEAIERAAIVEFAKTAY